MAITTLPKPLKPITRVSHAHWRMGGVLLATDILALTFSGSLGFYASHLLNPGLDPVLYWRLLPALGLFILSYALRGLYPGIALSGPEELLQLSRATTSIYLALGATSFLFQEAENYSRGAFLLSWFCSLVLLPLSRMIARSLFAAKSWWGYPVMILGAGKIGEQIVNILRRKPELGLKPVAILDSNAKTLENFPVRLPLMSTIESAATLSEQYGIHYAIVAMPGMPREEMSKLLERYGQIFPDLLVIPDLFEFSSLWAVAKDLDGFLGFEVRQRLLSPSSLLAKRILDLMIALVAGFIFLIPLVVIALLTWLDSPGPILFSQDRPGIGGKLFKILKFRTMYLDAEERFKNLSPELKEEFKTYGKIKNDPRVTRVGRWARKFSLDELPQLWNVFRGEMSLVGPRPYLKSQVAQMKGAEDLILRVPPGVTGIWQTSGRSTVKFEERLAMDNYYVRNWSVSLDIYILAQTFKVILSREGAY
jgi:Undecaprenyl-phosphate galactose phosphotransferase WbaP